MNCKDDEDWAPLSLATKHGYGEVVSELLNHRDAFVEIKCRDGRLSTLRLRKVIQRLSKY